MATCGDDIHVGDVGTVFEVTLKDCAALVDLSTTTVRQIKFKKPDGTYLTVAATLKTDGSDGIITYTSQAGDLDQVGSWEIRALITNPLGNWTSSKEKFKVQDVT